MYTNHCFTERQDRTKTDSERIFSIKRYELSKLLPGIIAGMNNKATKVLQTTAKKNFAYSVKTTLNEKAYNIFFKIKKSTAKDNDCDLVIYIESAYVFDEERKLEHSGRIIFLILCQKIYKGEKIHCRK